MNRISVVLLAVLAASCRVSTALPDDAKIHCETQADCPEGRDCEPQLGLCLLHGTMPPRQQVSFVSPGDGEKNVSTTATFVVAFTWPVDAASVGAHATLLRVANHPGEQPVAVPLTASASPVDSTVFLKPSAELDGLQRYTLVLAPGIEVATAGLALATDSETRIGFTSADRRDSVPPTPASPAGLRVDRVSATQVNLAWNNPSDSDLAGALIVRKRGAKLVLDRTAQENDLPVDGVAYAAGEKVGSTQPGQSGADAGTSPNPAVVAAVIHGTEVKLLDLEEGVDYDFAFFWFDRSSNYSSPRRVPFVTEAGASWCPDEKGSFHHSSPDQGTLALRFTALDGPSGGTPAELTIPSSPVALNADIPLAAADFASANSYRFSMRYEAANADGVFLSAPVPYSPSPASLAPLIQPAPAGRPIGLGGTATLTFSPYLWPKFEAQVDTDAQPGSEAWAAAAVEVSGNPAVGKASSAMSAAGSFRLRVRPVVQGCAPASWVTSDEFQVGGGVRYVSAAGSDSNDGLSRTSPLATVGKALSFANGTDVLDVLVTQGEYPEGITLRSNVRIFGGYSADFASRDPGPRASSAPPAHETRITGGVGPRGDPTRAVVFAPSFTKGSTVDGVTLIPPAFDVTQSSYGVYLDNGWTVWGGPQYAGATVTLSNDRIYSSNPGAPNQKACAVYSGLDAVQVVDSCELYGLATDAANDYGIRAWSPYVDSKLTVTNTLIRATIGVTFDSGYRVGFPQTNKLVMVGNRVEGRTAAGSPLDATAVGLRTTGTGPDLEVRDNLFRPDRRFDPYTQNSLGLDLSAGIGTVEGNRIEGGRGSRISMGVQVSATPPSGTSLRISNNFISAGGGVYSRTGVQMYYQYGGPNDLVFAHNTFLGVADGLNLPSGYGLTFINGIGSVRFVDNLFLGTFSKLAQLTSGQSWSFQNNLIQASSNLMLHWNNGSPLYAIPEFETFLCGHSAYASGNALANPPLANLFAPGWDADGDFNTLDDATWLPLKSAAATFAIGLDTSLAKCGAGACNGTGASWCGQVTADMAGVARPVSPAAPAAGALEPK